MVMTMMRVIVVDDDEEGWQNRWQAAEEAKRSECEKVEAKIDLNRGDNAGSETNEVLYEWCWKMVKMMWTPIVMVTIKPD